MHDNPNSATCSILRGWFYTIKVLLNYHARRVTSRFGHLERCYRRRLGKTANFTTPRTFNEKLGWLKEHHYPALRYAQLADKIAVRDLVQERIGAEPLIPLYGVYRSAAEIPFDALPDRFVLKCNHESGFVVLCQKKAALNQRLVRMQLATRLRLNHAYNFREWQYQAIQPRILAEMLLEDPDGKELLNYRFFCFHGTIEFIVVQRGQDLGMERGIFSANWEPMPFALLLPNAEPPLPRPSSLPHMCEIATELARDLLFCRIDLYGLSDGRVFFSEITLSPGAGMLKFTPGSYDDYWGDRLVLPTDED